MFARKVSLQLKPNGVAWFIQTSEKDIIPLLRKQPGLQDEIAFVVPGGTAAVAISVWDQQEHAEASARGTSPPVLQAVTKVVEGTPQGSTSEVANSPFHTIVPRVATWSGQVGCVRWGRLQPTFLWSGKATWTSLEDSVLPAVHFGALTAGRPEGPAEGAQRSFVAPRAPAHAEGALQGRRA
jgi:hypothetical protein